MRFPRALRHGIGAKSALYEGYTLHELRHIQATLLQGVVSPKAAQYRLGHSQISMTMNTYAHFLDAEDIAVAEAMDSILKPKAK